MPGVSSLVSGLQKVETGSTGRDTVSLTKDDVRERYRRERDLSKIRVIPARAETNPFDTATRKRVVVYCRVSTDGIQQTSSFELQKNYYLKFVRKKPEWKLVGLYSDEGITATSTEHRIGMLTMLEDARAGKFDIIVVKNLSRFSRNLMDCMKIIYELRDLPHPVGILFETENMYTLDKNVDFTLQVLSLVAQEESHKKSEAMTSSYQMRFSNGQFTKPDLLGYDRAGVNEICVNETEAQTVQLIFMMYLAGYDPSDIARTLNRLGRRKHVHRFRDGREKGGEINWNRCSVMNVLTNERRCGDVLAQKTYTPNYLDHKVKPNRNNLPQYYARDQHPAIVSRDDFMLANRILEANRGGWKKGLPHLGIYPEGPLEGFVASVPRWKGFSADDYVSASLKGHGLSDSEISAAIPSRKEEGDSISGTEQVHAPGFQHMLRIDSDDYEHFPDQEVSEAVEGDTARSDELSRIISSIRQAASKGEDARTRFGSFDFSGCEIVRPQLLSLHGKTSLTADSRGLYFNTECARRLRMKYGTVDEVEVAFNPVDQILIVRKSTGDDTRSMRWTGTDSEDRTVMRRCSCQSLTSAIFSAMGWNKDYKYRIIGSAVEVAGETMLAFFLDESVMTVPARPGSVRDMDTDISSADEGASDRNAARSRAIYYDEITEKSSGEISVDELGDMKYDPECIRRMIQRGITPREGWMYLKGVAVMNRKGFTIIPERWIGTFGDSPYKDSAITRFMGRLQSRCGEPLKEQPYGWTVGLELPSRSTVEETIGYLESRMA